MNGENGVLVDVGEVRKVVDNADVFAVGFRNFGKRLFVDTRSDADVRAMVAVVEPLASPQERFFWLGKTRPSLGVPKAFGYFNWPQSPNYLVESGIWELIRARVGAANDTVVDHQCETALKGLRGLERQATLAAIRGDDHLTLWSRSR